MLKPKSFVMIPKAIRLIATKIRLAVESLLAEPYPVSITKVNMHP